MRPHVTIQIINYPVKFPGNSLSRSDLPDINLLPDIQDHILLPPLPVFSSLDHFGDVLDGEDRLDVEAGIRHKNQGYRQG